MMSLYVATVDVDAIIIQIIIIFELYSFIFKLNSVSCSFIHS